MRCWVTSFTVIVAAIFAAVSIGISVAIFWVGIGDDSGLLPFAL